MKNIIFVAFSHKLQPSQIAGLQEQFGIEEADIVMLSDTNPELAKQCQQIDPAATLEEIQSIAALVVVEAVKAEATHFFCTGEPTLAVWANLFASTMADHTPASLIPFTRTGRDETHGNWWSFKTGSPFMKCVVSTTRRESVDEVQADGSIVKRAVFNHVQWRNMF